MRGWWRAAGGRGATNAVFSPDEKGPNNSPPVLQLSAIMSRMDEKRPPYDLKAHGPSGSGSPRHLPGRGPFPRLDDHLVVPELTRDEIIGGRHVVASPAKPPHATQHTRLDYVIEANVAPGYRAATDLITRYDVDSDFASDTCVFKDGVDPETGTRYLEEIAFEVVSKQNEGLVTEKAVRMHRRGVRRIFAIWVKSQRACEWSPESRSWRLLDHGASIEDPCLVKPLAVAALLHAAAADRAVVEALAAKGSPAIQERDAAAEARGMARSVFQVLEARGLEVSEAQRQEILGCRDLDRLDRWLRRAATLASADEILSEP
jgi:Putative restriction endonuclease